MCFLYRITHLIFLALLISHCGNGNTCDHQQTHLNTTRRPRYWAVRHCQRSNHTQLDQANVQLPRECADLARKRMALAFNFAPPKRGLWNRYEKSAKNSNNYTIVAKPKEPEWDEFFNCEVLACPEFETFSQMINDTRYDYYSMYANPPPPANATCLPRIGVFLYYDRFANYSEANAVCRRPHSQGGSAGTLAHILSAQRTNALSALIKSQRNTTRPGLAYVGLNQTEPFGPLYTSNAERFDCFLFRAWAPNHPRLAVKQAGCASVTTERSWKWHTCAKQLPFVCEVHTSRLAGRRALSVTGKCPKIT